MLLFVLTLASVYLVFGYQWEGGDPLTDPAVAWESLKFAGTLMAILLAHEMGHYIVARRHGFALSLPYFLPFPFAFGTLGAVIQLKSLPRSRTALLEMGAAGPLAGFVLSALAIAVGLPGTVDPGGPELMVPSAEELEALRAAAEADPGLLDQVLGLLMLPLVALGWVLEQTGAVPAPEPGTQMLSILANPPMMDWLGLLIIGEAPGPLRAPRRGGVRGWVGCLLTADQPHPHRPAGRRAHPQRPAADPGAAGRAPRAGGAVRGRAAAVAGLGGVGHGAVPDGRLREPPGAGVAAAHAPGVAHRRADAGGACVHLHAPPHRDRADPPGPDPLGGRRGPTDRGT